MNLIKLNLYQTCICNQYYNAQYHQDAHHISKPNQKFISSITKKNFFFFFLKNGNVIQKKRKTRLLDAKVADITTSLTFPH